MGDPRVRRAGFAATLLTGACLLGTGLYGIAGLDSSLRAAAPEPTDPPSTLVRDTWHQPRGGPECDGPADRRT